MFSDTHWHPLAYKSITLCSAFMSHDVLPTYCLQLSPFYKNTNPIILAPPPPCTLTHYTYNDLFPLIRSYLKYSGLGYPHVDLRKEQNQMVMVSKFVHGFTEVTGLSHVFHGKDIKIRESIQNHIWVNQKEKMINQSCQPRNYSNFY